jgi:antitoxin component YwqK of YwqJK toxin-antitoxin module
VIPIAYRSPWTLLMAAAVGVAAYFFFGAYSNPCRKDGPVTTAYKDGTPATTAVCKAGKLEGPAKSFHPNGAVKAEGAYVGGQQDGEWTYYGPDGKIAQRTRWSRGAKVLDGD